MLEIMPIPPDPRHINAERFLRMENEVLLANAVSTQVLYEEGISQDDAVEIGRYNNMFERVLDANGASPLIGTLNEGSSGKRLVGVTEFVDLDKTDLWHFLSPIEKLMSAAIRKEKVIQSKVIH
jgi:hypothetical protein